MIVWRDWVVFRGYSWVLVTTAPHVYSPLLHECNSEQPEAAKKTEMNFSGIFIALLTEIWRWHDDALFSLSVTGSEIHLGIWSDHFKSMEQLQIQFIEYLTKIILYLPTPASLVLRSGIKFSRSGF